MTGSFSAFAQKANPIKFRAALESKIKADVLEVSRLFMIPIRRENLDSSAVLSAVYPSLETQKYSKVESYLQQARKDRKSPQEISMAEAILLTCRGRFEEAQVSLSRSGTRFVILKEILGIDLEIAYQNIHAPTRPRTGFIRRYQNVADRDPSDALLAKLIAHRIHFLQNAH